MSTIELESIRRLDIKPGEVLVATLPNDASPAVCEDVKRKLKAQLPDNVTVLVTTNAEFHISSAREAPAAAAQV